MSKDDDAPKDSTAPLAADPFNFIGIDHPSSTCVVCLVKLDSATRTREHVYPQWLQNHVGIEKKRLTLPDGRLTQYDQLLVPLCATCNNDDLSKLEDNMADLFRSGTISPKSVPTGVLYLWLFKIYALNQIFSLSQPGWSFDPDGTGSNGLDPDLVNVALRRLSQTRASLADATTEPPPGSLLMSRVTNEVTDALGPFDWYDNPILGAAMLRVHDVVFHVCFEDNDAVASAMRDASSYKNPFDAPMSLQEQYDYSAAFFTHSISVRRPRYLFIGDTELVPAGAVSWEPLDRKTWHEYWKGFQAVWATARGLLGEKS